ncbi:hypothetical protein [Spirochaeta dissipatitropha]
MYLIKLKVLALLFGLCIISCGLPQNQPSLIPPSRILEGESHQDLIFTYEHQTQAEVGSFGYELYYKWYHEDNKNTFSTDVSHFQNNPVSRSNLNGRHFYSARQVDSPSQQPGITWQLNTHRYFQTGIDNESRITVYRAGSLDQLGEGEPLRLGQQQNLAGVTQVIPLNSDINRSVIDSYRISSEVRQKIVNHEGNEITLHLGFLIVAWGLIPPIQPVFSPPAEPSQTPETLFEQSIRIINQ